MVALCELRLLGGSLKEVLEIILAIISLIGIVYHIAKLETKVYDSIDSLKGVLSERFNSIQNQLNVHLAIYSERKEQVDYLLHALDQKIDHKFNRLHQDIKALQAKKDV